MLSKVESVSGAKVLWLLTHKCLLRLAKKVKLVLAAPLEKAAANSSNIDYMGTLYRESGSATATAILLLQTCY